MNPRMTQPLISVVIPFGDPRYVESWARAQICSPGAFEVMPIHSLQLTRRSGADDLGRHFAGNLRDTASESRVG